MAWFIETGLSCYILLRISNKYNYKEALTKPFAGWLESSSQKVVGLIDMVRKIRIERYFLQLLLSAEAIRLSGLGGYESTQMLAKGWIIDQQDIDGGWKSFLPFIDNMVMEFFEGAEIKDDRSIAVDCPRRKMICLTNRPEASHFYNTRTWFSITGKP